MAAKKIRELIETPVFDEKSMQVVKHEIANRIQKERENQKLDITQLALLTGMHYSHIYKIEKKQISPGLDTIMKICIALSIDIKTLIPLEIEEKERNKQTNGEKFDTITRNLETKDINYLLHMAKEMSKIRSIDTYEKDKKE